MAKKTQKELTELLKKTVSDTLGTRKSGWKADDTERTGLVLVKAQTDAEGKDAKLTADRIARITAAMQITPKRILQFIKTELKTAGAELDDVSESLLLKVLDVPKFRKELEDAGMIQPTGKGGKEKKATLKDLFSE